MKVDTIVYIDKLSFFTTYIQGERFGKNFKISLKNVLSVIDMSKLKI